ncbi:MAG: phosphatidylglycerophosphatase A family protein [Thermodesulfobacteriota bacterium]
MKNRLTTILASFFYLGYSPFAPGTMGTIGAIPLYYLMIYFLTNVQYVFVTIFLILFGIFISFKAIAIYKNDDPKEIVIDEVVGYLVAMAFITPTALNIILGFFLFRIFDIVKPFPARQLENLKGGYGVVMDDVAAGIWANLVLIAVNSYIIK